MSRIKTVDLTSPVSSGSAAAVRDVPVVQGDGQEYTALVYDFHHDSMIGTYIDFPGHIKETDDGQDAAGWPLEKLYRVEATVIRLNRTDGSGAVTAEELKAANPGPITGGGLIINALGSRRFDAIEECSVYLDSEAVSWVVDQGIHLFVSDVYESQSLHGVFGPLFEAGIATVCSPINLHQLTAPTVKLTALPARFVGATQLPCRLIAEMEL